MCGATATSTMSVDFSVPDRVVQMGFHAHQCGVCRTDDPYTDLADQLSAPTAAQAAKTLEEAWWRGWDRVASEDGGSWNAACSLPAMAATNDHSPVVVSSTARSQLADLMRNADGS